MASCVASLPPRSSAAEEHGGRSGTDESAQPSAPACADTNQRGGVSMCETGMESDRGGRDEVGK